jgi:flagellar biosynthesis protein FlhA
MLLAVGRSVSQGPTPTTTTSSAARGSTAELAIALAIVGIVLMMVIPLPGVLVDAMLAISLAVSIGVFLIGLFMEQTFRPSSWLRRCCA